MAVCKNLVQVPIATCKAIIDKKCGTGLASRVVKQLKVKDLRKSGNIRKMSTLDGDAS